MNLIPIRLYRRSLIYRMDAEGIKLILIVTLNNFHSIYKKIIFLYNIRMVWQNRKNRKYVPKNRRRRTWLKRRQQRPNYIRPSSMLALKRNTYSNNFVYWGSQVSGGASSFTKYDASTGGCVLTTSASIGQEYFSFGQAFCLRDLTARTEVTNLFDEYSIRKVIIKFTPMYTGANDQTGAGDADLNAVLHYAIDHNDYASPSADENGIDELRQRLSYKCVNMLSKGGRAVKIVIKPRVAVPVYAGEIASGYATGPKKIWLNTDYADTEHYGLRGVFEVYNPSANAHFISYRYDVTYYCLLRGLK